MAGILTKADLLKTARQPEEVEIEGREGKFLLRPVTDGEYQHARNIVMKGITASADLDKVTNTLKTAKKKGSDKGAELLKGMQISFDIGSFTDSEFESKVYLVSRALSVNEQWSTDEVKALTPVGIVEKLCEKVYEISNISETMEELVKSFRSL